MEVGADVVESSVAGAGGSGEAGGGVAMGASDDVAVEEGVSLAVSMIVVLVSSVVVAMTTVVVVPTAAVSLATTVELAGVEVAGMNTGSMLEVETTTVDVGGLSPTCQTNVRPTFVITPDVAKPFGTNPPQKISVPEAL